MLSFVPLLLALIQVAGPPDVRPKPLRSAITAPCPSPDASGDVVVCGRVEDGRFRARPLPERYVESVVPTAQVKLKGGGSITAHGEAGSVGNIPTNRAMVTLKLPF